jgi:hypothetical protein
VAKQDTSFEDFINGLSKASPDTILKIAQQLKDAKLYKGKITGKFDQKLYGALVLASQGYKSANLFAEKFKSEPVTPIGYLQQIGMEGLETGTGSGTGYGGPTTTKQTYVTSPTQTAKLLNTVAEDLLGRKLTKAEQNKYQKLINAEQKRQPAVNVSGKGFSTTRGGVDEEQFITEKIAGTAEAKTNQASDAYTILMQELGGLR